MIPRTITMVQEMTMMEALADIFTFNVCNILNICRIHRISITNSIMLKEVAINLPSLEVEVEALTSRLSILHPALSSALGGSAHHTG